MTEAVVYRERETSAAPTIEPLPAPAGTALTPMQMAYQLIARGADAGSVKEMLDVSREFAADQARRAFDAAMAEAKAEIPPVLKNREVDFTSPKGRTRYRHEDLAEIARTVDPILGRHGLSYRFRTTSNLNEPVSVTCIVAHRDGHSEENTLSAGRDDSGNKNSIQSIGSTITYLQRYTLKAALGLAASADDDGAKSDEQIRDLINIEQRDELLRLIDETNSDPAGFCRYFKIEAVPDLPAAKFGAAKQTLERKRAAQ